MTESLTFYRTAGYKIVARMTFYAGSQRQHVQCWVYNGGLGARMQINLSQRQLAAKLEPEQVPDDVRRDAEARFLRLKTTEAERKRNDKVRNMRPDGLRPVTLARAVTWR